MDERAFHLDYAQQDRLPQMDQALTTPIDGLHVRGLNRRVLVIACGEFGRTPRVAHAVLFTRTFGSFNASSRRAYWNNLPHLHLVQSLSTNRVPFNHPLMTLRRLPRVDRIPSVAMHVCSFSPMAIASGHERDRATGD